MTDIYVDTSALLKRVFVESESEDVRAVLRDHHDRGDLLVSSDLTWVELSRAFLRAGAPDIDAAIRNASSGIARFPLGREVLRRAERIGPAGLRSLDAIHLAAAVAVGTSTMMTYDARLADAAKKLGLVVIPESTA